MNRRLALLPLVALLVSPPLAAKKRPRVQDKGVTTLVLDPSDGPEAIKEALREAKIKGSVRVVFLPPEGTSSSLASPAGAYRPSDVQMNDPAYDGFPGYFRAEPSIAAQGDAVVCVYNDSGPDTASPNPGSGTDGFSISADGGTSWRDMGKRAPLGLFSGFYGDNVVAAGPDADFYYLSDGGKGGGSWNAMAASRSTDGGKTWTAPTSPSLGVISHIGGFYDKGWIAVDRSSTATRGNVYVTWSDFGDTSTDLYVARSTDHGATWSAQRLDSFPHPVAVTYVQVASNGLVYVGEQDEGTILNESFTGTNYVRVSADGGSTYSALRPAGPYRSVGDRVAMDLCGDPGFFGGLIRYLNGPIEADSSLRIAVDPSDPSGKTAFVTTQGIPDTPGDGSDVLLWRSTDGGLTWGEPVRVNDDTTKTDQFMPDLWVAPDGTLGVLWLDRRNDPKANWRLEAWMALSKDHGASFGCSFPVSSHAFPPVGRCQMSDYDAVYADEHGFLLAWGDSRQVDPQKQMTFAIYGANVPLDGPGPILSVDQARVDPKSPFRLSVRLRNDGTADARDLTVAVSIDGNQLLAPVVSVRFPDVRACHGTAEAVLEVPYSTSTPDLRGTIQVQGPLGSTSLRFSAARPSQLPGGTLLSAGFESGLGDFTASGSLWHLTTKCAALATGHGGTSAAFFGDDATCGWNTSSRPAGALTSKPIALPTGGAVLRFREAVGLYSRWMSDQLHVQISTDGGASFENLWGYGSMSRYVLDTNVPLTDNGGNPSWHDVALDLSDYGGHDVLIRFFAYAGLRPGKGWAIDDVSVTSTSAIPNAAMGTCAAPQEITAGTQLFDSTASTVSGDPSPACGAGSVHHPFWTTFTPPVDGEYWFSACTAAGSGTLSAWSGSCGALAPLGCAPIGACGGLGATVLKVAGSAGVPIRLLVSGSSESDSGLFTLVASARAEGTLVPIVLDVPTATAHFTTELALTNHANAPAALTLNYTAAIGSGTGKVPATLGAGSVLRMDDVLAWLRSAGLSIPTSGGQGGTLRVEATGVPAGSVSAVARTLTPAGRGAASLAYAAVPMDAPTRTTVFGLRTNLKDRSNLAVFNPSLQPVTFRVTVVSGAGDGRRVVIRDSDTLPAGGWTQYDGVLGGTGIANGWAEIERTSVSGTVNAYGVVNDNTTNDGSYMPPVADGGTSASLTVPVLVETPRYTTELVLANRGSTSANLTLRYLESLDDAGGSAAATLTLAPGTQRILVDAIDFLRSSGGTLGPAGRSYAGALRIEVEGAAPGDVWAAARVSAPVTGGGAFGLFVPGVLRGSEASDSATLDGLRADAANRSNVALVNAGVDGAGPVTLRLQAYDGATGAAAGSALDVTLEPGGWAQPGNVFSLAKGWVTVTRISGTAPWIAYGVVNDGGHPGERTDDGAAVTMRAQ